MEDILCLDSSFYAECISYDEKFARLTKKLLNETLLMINDVVHRLEEIELYLHTDDHQDKYTHRDVDQSVPCMWYFHKQNGGKYKGGTYKGLDITFGFKVPRENTFGGILIRGISSEQNGKYINGPCRVVDYILKQCGADSIQDLVSVSSKKVDEKSKLYLKARPAIDRIDRVVYTGPRVGLSFKIPEMAVRNYRYLTNIHEIDKYKAPILVNMVNAGKSIDTVARETKTRVKLIEQYVNLYNEGKSLNSITDLKANGSGIISLSGYQASN